MDDLILIDSYPHVEADVFTRADLEYWLDKIYGKTKKLPSILRVADAGEHRYDSNVGLHWPSWAASSEVRLFRGHDM